MGVAGNLVRKRDRQPPFSFWQPKRGSEVIVRQVRVLVLAAMVAAATVGALVWSVTAGSALASAATRLRSGTLHAQLVSHVSAGANTAPAGVTLTGSGVMAAIVGALALFALAFLVVTLIRRRVTAA
jgi:hypothetical protein